MNNAIDRIKGYCTEVNQAQWEELVRVADEVGCDVGGPISDDVGGPISDRPISSHFFIRYYDEYGLISVLQKIDRKLIPFPDFLARMKGWNDEAEQLISSNGNEWNPEIGEQIEVSDGYGQPWHKGEYIAKSRGLHIAWTEGDDDDDVSYWNLIRPLRPTITRAEAEQKLGKRIID